MKKTLSLVLALVMVALMLPVAAFTTSAEEVPYHYYEDFTKATPDDGSTGNITANLPTGWVAKDDPDLVPTFKAWPTTINYDWSENPHSENDEVYLDELKNVGVRLGGAGQFIAMNDQASIPDKILNATTDYYVKINFNTTHKFSHIYLAWSGADADTQQIVVPDKTSNSRGASSVAFLYCGGPSGGDAINFGSAPMGPDQGANVKFNEKFTTNRQDEYACQLNHDKIYGLFHDPFVQGSNVELVYEVVDGNCVAVYVTCGGATVKYVSENPTPALGYMIVSIDYWATNNTANIRSFEIQEGAYDTNKAVFPEISNTEILFSTDFTSIKTDAALEGAGWNFYAVKPADSGDYIPKVDYVDGGIALNAANNDFLINTATELDNNSTYIIDYSVKMNPAVWIFTAGLGFDVASTTSDAADDAAKMADIVKKLSAEYGSSVNGKTAFLMRANINNKKMACDGYTYFDETWMQNLGATMPSQTALEAACGMENESIRIRILVSKGTGQLVFMTIGDEHFYLKKNSAMTQDGIAGLFGFTFHGEWHEGRGMLIERASIIKCDLGDTTGGDEIKAEKDKAYTDAAATYYKDGYLLHYMDFAAEGLDWAGTGYSFASNSSKERIVKVENEVLKFTNTGSKAAYLMFTANAIPQAITEYTATYSFRFVGEVNSYFGFIRGTSLKDDGARDKSETVEFSYKGEINDFETADTVAWEAIVAAMKAGEWVTVSVSNVGRYAESVTVVCGENTATFKMDPEENKVAPDGYMGFIIGKSTSVEVQGVAIMAGKADSFTAPIVPTGTEAGALVQNVLAEAVAEGTKPDYTDVINQLLGTNTDIGDDPIDDPVDDPVDDPAQTTTAATTTAATTAAKKGCKGSLVAVPAIIATAIFGCAVVCKKKED